MLASWKHGQLANTEALFTAATHTSQNYTLASRGLVRGMSAMAKASLLFNLVAYRHVAVDNTVTAIVGERPLE